MKTKTALTALLLLVAASLSAGCNNSTSSGSTTGDVVASISEQVEGGDTRLTTYEYDTQGAVSRETQTLNGKPVYIASEFSNAATPYSHIRTYYNDDGSTYRHKVEISGAYTSNLYTLTTDTFLLDSSTTTPFDTVKDVKNVSYSPYRDMGYKHTVDGEVVLERSDYDYSEYYSATPTFTYVEKRAGEERVRVTKTYTDTSLRGYKLYELSLAEVVPANVVLENELVEELTDYSRSGNVITYKVTNHRGDTPVTTIHTITYRQITIYF